MTQETKHYVVILEPAAKPNTKLKATEVSDLEYKNALNIREDIKHVAQSLNIADEVKDINIVPGAPVMYIECTPNALKEIENVHGVKQTSPNLAFEEPKKQAPRATMQPPKRRGPFNIFKR